MTDRTTRIRDLSDEAEIILQGLGADALEIGASTRPVDGWAGATRLCKKIEAVQSKLSIMRDLAGAERTHQQNRMNAAQSVTVAHQGEDVIVEGPSSRSRARQHMAEFLNAGLGMIAKANGTAPIIDQQTTKPVDPRLGIQQRDPGDENPEAKDAAE